MCHINRVDVRFQCDNTMSREALKKGIPFPNSLLT